MKILNTEIWLFQGYLGFLSSPTNQQQTNPSIFFQILWRALSPSFGSGYILQNVTDPDFHSPDKFLPSEADFIFFFTFF